MLIGTLEIFRSEVRILLQDLAHIYTCEQSFNPIKRLMGVKAACSCEKTQEVMERENRNSSMG